MDNNQGMIGMALGSWLVGLAGGVLAAVLLWVLGGWSFFQGAFMGFVAFVVFGAVISWVMTRPLPGPADTNVAPPETAPAPTPQTARAAPNSGITPSKSLAGQAELASRKGEWKYEAEKPAKKTAPKKQPAKKAAAKQPAASSNAEDDLKLISGVGPALEKKLHAAGIFRFEQIANMSADDVERIEEQLSFKGRMERDDWIGQAKTLAAGGETEFSKKKRKS
ncbi:helix-hairpin-helix domain-containing protein [uncultured Roseobacter sp.]|uniref:helix-hairpin-helix domain-containing protein n=1 Tax=uncultured Roseobacter sp. TaxID=114847 RepID=UPI0026042211|nr:helix-hairpin-helix domain-containing protein [uncultured Roseobacter sp.]